MHHIHDKLPAFLNNLFKTNKRTFLLWPAMCKKKIPKSRNGSENFAMIPKLRNGSRNWEWFWICKIIPKIS